MRFSLFVAIVLALLLVACSGPSESTPEVGPGNTESSPTGTPLTPKSPENILVETPEYTGVIISESGASEFGYVFGKAPSGFWEPSIDDVSRAEKCIRQFLESYLQDPNLDIYQREKVAFILENLEQYRRQYVSADGYARRLLR